MPKRVLIIDDDVNIARVLMIRLKAAGYESMHAPNGIAGLAIATEQRPDAILLDIRMPGMDGFEVNQRLKSTPKLMDIPVIILSAHVNETAREAARASGVYSFIEKPYDPKHVIRTIANATSNNSSKDKIAVSTEDHETPGVVNEK